MCYVCKIRVLIKCNKFLDNIKKFNIKDIIIKIKYYKIANSSKKSKMKRFT